MTASKYSVNQHPIQTILTWIRSGEIAIPEIQRPFVWKSTKVRDFVDSLYRGYPVGYLIAWRNPSVRLKDGSISQGKRILIDGQQRVIALRAALIGERVVNKKYRQVHVRIAFHPSERKFEVANSAIRKDRQWIPDISKVLSPEVRSYQMIDEYCLANPEVDKYDICDSIEQLRMIINHPIGLIELNSDLDIQTVTEIFIRINSKGVPLDQADFAMSKIAANESYGGNQLRKTIDYFCHLAVAPECYDQLVQNDPAFSQSESFRKMSWLRNENDDLYDPSYTDMLRVAFTSEFKRGRLEDLVALLSGRNFETRTYEEQIAENAFERLRFGLDNFMNETHFKRFIMIVRSAGLVDTSMIRSQNALNFAYIVYLVLRSQKMDAGRIETLVRRWLVMSLLTGRYSSSPESAFDVDIRSIERTGVEAHLERIEQSQLSEAFWRAGLPQQLQTPVSSNPIFKLYLASQVKMNHKGFLSRDISVMDLIIHKGDIHHIFPRHYLKKNGFAKNQYNQVANYVIAQSEINIAIGNKPPSQYFSELLTDCEKGTSRYGAICDPAALRHNLECHCIPQHPDRYSADQYESFLEERRKLMAASLNQYYDML